MPPATARPALESALAALLDSRPEALADPQRVWRALRDQSPVHRHDAVVLVTRHADVKDILRDPVRFSSLGRSAGSRAEALRTLLDPEHAAAWTEVSAFEDLYVSRSDGEAHERRRRAVHRTFTPRRIAELDGSTRRYVARALDGMAGTDPVDVVPRLAWWLPLMVIGDLLGVPEPDRPRIHAWSRALVRNRGGEDPDVLMAAHRAMREFRAYVDALLATLRTRPGTDLLSALLGAEAEDRLSPAEVTAMCVVLLFAGHETTTNLIANGLVELLQDREQWDRLVEDPGLVSDAVEELLRFVAPVQWVFRVTTEPVTVRGSELPAGQTALAVIAAANRDSEVFPDPERLDVGRPDARQHLSLGFGPHFCLGNALARMEGAAVLDALVRRHPGARLTGAPLRWTGHAQLRGLEALPIELGQAAER
jgi:cytochrome P450